MYDSLNSDMNSRVAWLVVTTILLIILFVFVTLPLVMLLLFLFSLNRHARCLTHGLSERRRRIVMLDPSRD